jgi:hypothetical protein
MLTMPTAMIIGAEYQTDLFVIRREQTGGRGWAVKPATIGGNKQTVSDFS